VKSAERLELRFLFPVLIFLSFFSFVQVGAAPAPDFHAEDKTIP
jgi:hypothetical protein